MFQLDAEQLAKLNDWRAKKDLNAPAGCNGGRFTYHFTPTSLGTVVKVSDVIDGDEVDLSFYETW